MNERLQSIIEMMPAIATAEQMTRFLRRFKNVYDFDNAIYYALSLGGDRAGEEFGAMTYPAAWHQRYEDVRYRDFDPVVHSALGGFAPFDWASLDWSGRPVKRLLSEASEFRVGNQGYSVPIHGPNGQFAMFSVSKHCSERDWALLVAEVAQDMLLLAYHIHRQVLEITGADARSRDLALSPRERDVLTMVAAGASRARIAERLTISESTVRVYLDSARHKLGALNAFHAVAIGVRQGIVKV